MSVAVADPSAGPPERRRRFARRHRLVTLGITLLVLAALSQFLLPMIAARYLRASLEEKGEDVSVSLTALPAVELVFGHADSATIHIGSLRAGGEGSMQALLSRAGNVTDLNATIHTMLADGLLLENVSLTKHGSLLTATAHVTRRAIETALPIDLHLTDQPEGAHALTLTASTSLLGHSISASARLLVSGGALQISPDLPVLDLLRITVFSDPHVAVDTISLRGSGTTYTFLATAHYT